MRTTNNWVYRWLTDTYVICKRQSLICSGLWLDLCQAQQLSSLRAVKTGITVRCRCFSLFRANMWFQPMQSSKITQINTFMWGYFPFGTMGICTGVHGRFYWTEWWQERRIHLCTNSVDLQLFLSWVRTLSIFLCTMIYLSYVNLTIQLSPFDEWSTYNTPLQAVWSNL